MKKLTKLFALLAVTAMLAGCTAAVDVKVEGTVEAKSPDTTTAAAATTASLAEEIAHETAQATEQANEPETTAATTTAATTASSAEEIAPETAQATEQANEPETTTAVTTSTAAAAMATTAAVTENTAAVTTATTATEPATRPDEAVEKKYVALTFDDGPANTTTSAVLDMLEKYDITASFFLVGANINDDSAEVVKRAYDMGCEINHHSTTHPYMNEMTVDEIIAEFNTTDDLIYSITGERSKFFRPPYIAVSQDMLDNIDVPFISGIGCNDWDDKVTVERRHAMIMRQVKDGSIILLHDAAGNSKTVEALDLIIPDMLSQGYEFVTVSELFEIYGVEISGDDEKIYSNVHQTTMY